jgi:putative DNA primase/helicase
MEISSEYVRKYYETNLNIELPPEGTTSSPWMTIRCPFHNDCSPSFRLNTENGIWKCHAHCGAGDMIEFEQKLTNCDFKTAIISIKEQLGLKDTHEATYTYHDPNGKFAFATEKWRDGLTQHKSFSIWHNLPSCQKVWKRPEKLYLYRLPEVIAASTVMIVEGEKCADVLRTLLQGCDVAVTTAPLGSNARWDASYTECLKGKKVYVLPDNDEAGFKHVNKIIDALKPVVSELKAIITPTDDPPGRF